MSDSILGEQTLVVSEEKVSIARLQTQLVSGLSLSLTSEPGHPNVFTAVCQGVSALQSLKQVRRPAVQEQRGRRAQWPADGWVNLICSIFMGQAGA